MKHHPEDHPTICRQHEAFADRVSDAVMAVQDEAYQLGRERGKAEADAALLAALLQLMPMLESTYQVNGVVHPYLAAARTAIAGSAA